MAEERPPEKRIIEVPAELIDRGVSELYKAMGYQLSGDPKDGVEALLDYFLRACNAEENNQKVKIEITEEIIDLAYDAMCGYVYGEEDTISVSAIRAAVRAAIRGIEERPHLIQRCNLLDD